MPRGRRPKHEVPERRHSLPGTSSSITAGSAASSSRRGQLQHFPSLSDACAALTSQSRAQPLGAPLRGIPERGLPSLSPDNSSTTSGDSQQTGILPHLSAADKILYRRAGHRSLSVPHNLGSRLTIPFFLPPTQYPSPRRLRTTSLPPDFGSLRENSPVHLLPRPATSQAKNIGNVQRSNRPRPQPTRTASMPRIGRQDAQREGSQASVPQRSGSERPRPVHSRPDPLPPSPDSELFGVSIPRRMSLQSEIPVRRPRPAAAESTLTEKHRHSTEPASTESSRDSERQCSQTVSPRSHGSRRSAQPASAEPSGEGTSPSTLPPMRREGPKPKPAERPRSPDTTDRSGSPYTTDRPGSPYPKAYRSKRQTSSTQSEAHVGGEQPYKPHTQAGPERSVPPPNLQNVFAPTPPPTPPPPRSRTAQARLGRMRRHHKPPKPPRAPSSEPETPVSDETVFIDLRPAVYPGSSQRFLLRALGCASQEVERIKREKRAASERLFSLAKSLVLTEDTVGKICGKSWTNLAEEEREFVKEWLQFGDKFWKQDPELATGSVTMLEMAIVFLRNHLQGFLLNSQVGWYSELVCRISWRLLDPALCMSAGMNMEKEKFKLIRDLQERFCRLTCDDLNEFCEKQDVWAADQTSLDVNENQERWMHFRERQIMRQVKGAARSYNAILRDRAVETIRSHRLFADTDGLCNTAIQALTNGEKFTLDVSSWPQLCTAFAELAVEENPQETAAGYFMTAWRHIPKQLDLLAKEAVEKSSLALCWFVVRRGCPPQYRAAVWSQLLGTTDVESRTMVDEFKALRVLVSEEDLALDEAVHLDVHTSCKRGEYFVFEDVLHRAVLLFLRDTWVSNHLPIMQPKVLVASKQMLPRERPKHRQKFVPWVKDQEVVLAVRKPARQYPPCGAMPRKNFALYIAPLGFVFKGLPSIYFNFRQLYVRHFYYLHALSSHKQSLLGLLCLFETLLAKQMPDLYHHLIQLGVQLFRFPAEWITTAFSQTLSPDQLLILWDLMIGFGTTEVFPLLAAAVFFLRRESLLHCDTLPEVYGVLGVKLKGIQVIPLLQIYMKLHHE